MDSLFEWSSELIFQAFSEVWSRKNWKRKIAFFQWWWWDLWCLEKRNSPGAWTFKLMRFYGFSIWNSDFSRKNLWSFHKIKGNSSWNSLSIFEHPLTLWRPENEKGEQKLHPETALKDPQDSSSPFQLWHAQSRLVLMKIHFQRIQGPRPGSTPLQIEKSH